MLIDNIEKWSESRWPWPTPYLPIHCLTVSSEDTRELNKSEEDTLIQVRHFSIMVLFELMLLMFQLVMGSWCCSCGEPVSIIVIIAYMLIFFNYSSNVAVKKLLLNMMGLVYLLVCFGWSYHCWLLLFKLLQMMIVMLFIKLL